MDVLIEMQHLLVQQKNSHGQTTADKTIIAIRSFCLAVSSAVVP
jgi:hypothetical protein